MLLIAVTFCRFVKGTSSEVLWIFTERQRYCCRSTHWLWQISAIYERTHFKPLETSVDEFPFVSPTRRHERLYQRRSANLYSRAWHRMQVNNIFMVNFIFCPLKTNTWRLKNIASNRNEPKQCINTWQITEVSNSKKRHADKSGNHVDLWPGSMTYRTLSKHDLTAQFHRRSRVG